MEIAICFWEKLITLTIRETKSNKGRKKKFKETCNQEYNKINIYIKKRI